MVNITAAQNATVCNGAQNLCTNPILTFTANSGTGLNAGLGVSNPFINPQSVNAGCMFSNVPNPQWLLINITSSGNLGFSFGAFGSTFPQAGNYDWIMWPYSPGACTNIFNNTLPPVACNWNCTGSGGTGMGTVPAGASACNFQPSIPVTQGQQFILLITNPSGVNTNVSFSSTGSAGVSCNPLNYPNLTACPGELAVFTGTWVGAASGTYTLYPGAIVQTNPSFTVSSLSNQVYTVIAQGLNASSASITDQTTFSLTINPNVPITVTTPTNYCYGNNATFTITPSGGTYSVTGPGIPTTTFFTNTISIPNITTTNIGTFSVIANYTTGCIGSTTTPINVAPNYSITVNTSSNICQGGNVNLTASMPTATAYSWFGVNTFTSNLQNPTLNTILPSASGVYTINADINFNGITCPQTNTTQINVVAINIITVTPNFTLCQGANLNLTANATSATSYSWSGPNSFNSNLQNPVNSGILPSEAGNYSVTAFFTNGTLTCNSLAVSNLSVVPITTVNVITPQNICQNATANLSVSATNAIGYSWSGPNAFVSNMTTPSITNIQPSSSGIYTSTALFAIGSVSCTATGTNQINVVATSTISVTPSFTLCEGANLNLLANASSAISYSWSGPGSYTSAIQNPTITSINPLSAGNYTVTSFFTNSFLTCTTNAVSNVSVVTTPTVNVIYPANVCKNATVNFVANAAGASSYSWYGPNSFTSNISSPSISGIQPNATGVYSTTAIFSIGTLTCSSTSTNQLNIVGTSTVAVTPGFTICEGTNLNLLANAASASSYLWQGPNSYTSSSQNPIITGITASGSGNYTTTAFFTNGSLTCTTSAISGVSIVPTPSVNINVPANICQNATATISANANGANSYAWSGPNGFVSNTATSSIVSIQPIGTGIYTVTATFVIGSINCANSNTSQINVVAINSITLNSTLNGCALQANVLQANSVGALSYTWSGPNSFTSSVASPTLYNTQYTAAGIYTLITSYGNGSLTCFNSTTLNLIVNPVISFTLPTTQFVCYKSVLIVPGPIGASSYTWQNASGVISNSQDLSVPNISLNQSGTYSLTASIGFCATTQTIYINVSNPIQYTLVPTNTTVCSGDSIVLNVGSIGGSGNYAYDWNPPVFLSSPTGSTEIVKPFGTTIYDIHGYDIACPNYTISHTFTVTVQQAPVPNLQLSRTAGCEPFCTFYNSKTRSSATSVIYDFGNNNQVAADSVYYCLPEHGTYSLTILTKGINGCSGKFKYATPIVVYPKPHADFYNLPQIPSLSDNQVTFFPSYNYGPVVSQNWMFGGTGKIGYDSTNAKYPQRSYETPGKYPVMLISRTDNGCADTIFKLLEITEDILLYIPDTFTPNGDGINDSFIVYGFGFSKDNFLMELFTRAGSQIYFSKDYSIGWDGKIDGKPAEDGCYVYKIRVLGAHREGYKEFMGKINLIR